MRAIRLYDRITLICELVGRWTTVDQINYGVFLRWVLKVMTAMEGVALENPPSKYATDVRTKRQEMNQSSWTRGGNGFSGTSIQTSEWRKRIINGTARPATHIRYGLQVRDRIWPRIFIIGDFSTNNTVFEEKYMVDTWSVIPRCLLTTRMTSV